MSHRDHVSTRSQPDSGIDPDNISQASSVTEYLVSLGVNPDPVPPKPRHRRRDTVDSHLNDLIYAKVEDVVGPGPLDVSKRMDYLDREPIMVSCTKSLCISPSICLHIFVPLSLSLSVLLLKLFRCVQIDSPVSSQCAKFSPRLLVSKRRKNESHENMYK